MCNFIPKRLKVKNQVWTNTNVNCNLIGFQYHMNHEAIILAVYITLEKLKTMSFSGKKTVIYIILEFLTVLAILTAYSIILESIFLIYVAVY